MSRYIPIEYSQMKDLFFIDPSSPSGLSRLPKRKHTGTLRDDGKGRKSYVVFVSGVGTLAVSRIVFCLHNGSIDPELQVDHIDQDSTNNSPDNLRQIPDYKNARNRKNTNSKTTNLPKYIRVARTTSKGDYYRAYVPTSNGTQSKCSYDLEFLVKWRDEILGSDLHTTKNGSDSHIHAHA